jgi:mannose-1-phosphate guanylyltransferase/phosphomannomutase
VDEGVVVKAGAHIGPYSVVGRHCHIEEHAHLDRAIVWANNRISQEATVRRSILGRHCHIGRSALVDEGVVLGDKSVVTDYSRL